MDQPLAVLDCVGKPIAVDDRRVERIQRPGIEVARPGPGDDAVAGSVAVVAKVAQRAAGGLGQQAQEQGVFQHAFREGVLRRQVDDRHRVDGLFEAQHRMRRGGKGAGQVLAAGAAGRRDDLEMAGEEAVQAVDDGQERCGFGDVQAGNVYCADGARDEADWFGYGFGRRADLAFFGHEPEGQDQQPTQDQRQNRHRIFPW